MAINTNGTFRTPTNVRSDLFKKQGEPPHIKELTYSVHEVLPGTEIALDKGAWTGK